MSCQLETAVAGDVNDVRQIALGGDITSADLVGATVVGRVWAEGDDPSTAVELVGAIFDQPRRIISINLGGIGGWLPSAAPGDYLIEYELTLSDGRVWTWPSAAPDRIHVRAGGS